MSSDDASRQPSSTPQDSRNAPRASPPTPTRSFPASLNSPAWAGSTAGAHTRVEVAQARADDKDRDADRGRDDENGRVEAEVGQDQTKTYHGREVEPQGSLGKVRRPTIARETTAGMVGWCDEFEEAASGSGVDALL